MGILGRCVAAVAVLGGAILAAACSGDPAPAERSAPTSEALGGAQCDALEIVDDCEPDGPKGQILCTCGRADLPPLEPPPTAGCATPNKIARPMGLTTCTPGTTIYGRELGWTIGANIWLCPDALASNAQSLGYQVASNSHGFQDGCVGPAPDGMFYAVKIVSAVFPDGGAPGTGCSGPCNLLGGF